MDAELHKLQAKYNALKASCLEMLDVTTQEELAGMKKVMEAFSTLGNKEATKILPMINALLNKHD